MDDPLEKILDEVEIEYVSLDMLTKLHIRFGDGREITMTPGSFEVLFGEPGSEVYNTLIDYLDIDQIGYTINRELLKTKITLYSSKMLEMFPSEIKLRD